MQGLTKYEDFFYGLSITFKISTKTFIYEKGSGQGFLCFLGTFVYLFRTPNIITYIKVSVILTLIKAYK